MTSEDNNFADIEKVKSAIQKFKKDGWPTFNENENIEEFVEKIRKQITEEIDKFPNFLL